MQIEQSIDVPNYEFIVDHIVKRGIPLVLTNTTSGWERDTFGWDWLKEHMGSAPLVGSPRDNDALKDLSDWTVGQYLIWVFIQVFIEFIWVCLVVM